MGKMFYFSGVGCLLLALAGPVRGATPAPDQTGLSSAGLMAIEADLYTLDGVYQVDHVRLEQKVVSAVQRYPELAYGHYLVGMFYLQQFESTGGLRFLKKASELGQQAVDLQDKSDFGYLIIAKILHLMGQSETAAQLLSSLQQEELGYRLSWRFHVLRADILGTFGVGSADQMETYQKALATAPKEFHEAIHFRMERNLEKAWDGADIVSKAREVRARFPSQWADMLVAGALRKRGYLASAGDLYLTVYRADRLNLRAGIEGARALMRGDSRFGTVVATDILTKILANQKDHLHPDLQADSQILLGQGFLNLGKHREARTSFLKGLAVSGNPGASFARLMEIYRDLGHARELVELIDVMIARRGGLQGGTYYALKGEVLSVDLSKHLESIESYQNAILIEPDRSDYFNGLAMVYYRASQMHMALRTFSQAARLDPLDALSKYNQACILARLGREKEAFVKLEEALSLDPLLANSAKTDQDFAQIKDSTAFEILVNRR